MRTNFRSQFGIKWSIIEKAGDHFALAALGAFGQLLHTTQDRAIRPERRQVVI